jgi:fibronectin-binding autotransporter adhesin
LTVVSNSSGEHGGFSNTHAPHTAPGAKNRTYEETTLLTARGEHRRRSVGIGWTLLLGLLVALGHCLAGPTAAYAQTWVPTGSGPFNWNDNANWSVSPFPNSATASASLSSLLTANQTINLNVAVQVNQLTLNSSSFSYNVAGNGGGLTFAGSTPGLTVASGSVNQTISAPITTSSVLVMTQNSTAGAMTISGTVNNGGNLLTIAGAGDTTFSNVISGAGGLTKSGTGTLTLTGANTYSGVTIISAGTVRIGNGGTTGSVAGNITVGGGIVFNRSDSVVYAGVMNGAGTVIQQGVGTLILTGANTASGGTTVAAGTLQVGNGGTVGALSNNNLVISAGAAAAFNRSDNYTFGGVISGTGSLNQLGGGILILNGANTFTGISTISAGTLQLGSGSTNGTVGGAIVNNGALAVNRSNAVTLSGNITGSGGLTKSGAGILTLSGANSFAGAVTLNSGGGGIVFANSGALGSGAPGSITVAAGTYAAAGYAVDSTFVNRIAGTSAGVVALAVPSSNNLDFGAAGLTVASLGATANVTYSGTLTPANNTFRLGGGSGTNPFTLTVSSALNGANSLVVDGNGTTAGTVVLSNISNGYTGTTTVNSGTLRFGVFNSIGGSGASITVASGATVAADFAFDQTFLARINPSSAGVVALNSTGTNASLNFSGLNNVSLGTTASAGYGNALTTLTPANNTFRFGGGGSGALTVNAPLTGLFNSVVIASNGTVAGTVIFGSLANSYGGSTTVSAGTLQFNSALSIGGLGASVLVNAGATASTNYAMDQPFLNRINSASAGVVAIAVASSNNLDFNAPGLSGVSFGSKNALTYSGTLTPNGTTYRLGGGGGALTVSSNLTGPGNAVVVRDSGNLILAGNNTFGGGLSTDVAHPDTGIIVANAGGLSTGNVTFANRTVNSSATAPVLGFDLGASSSTTFANNIALDGSSLLKDFSIQANNSQSVTLSGLISGGNAASSLQFTNFTNGHTGTFVLSNAANSFQGTVEVVQGILAVSNDTVLGNASNAIKLSLITGTAGGFQFTTGFTTARGLVVNKDSRIIQADAINPATVSGVVSGSGVTLFKAGVGTLILSNATNTFAGNFSVDAGTLLLTGGNNSVASTTVNSGTILQVGNGGTTGSLAGSINNLAALVFNRSDALTSTGAIGGGGSVTQQGAGTLTLSGNNGSNGAYTVAAGTLVLTGTNAAVTGATVNTNTTLSVGNGGATGTLAGGIANGGSVVFNRSSASTFGGAISGVGSVSQQGSGTLTLTGTSSYTGATTITAGAVALTGSLGNTAVSLGAGTTNSGTLSGTGTVGGAVTAHAGGTVAPGTAAFGTLTVGALTVEGGATVNGPRGALAVRIGPTTTDHDLLVTAFLDFAATGFAERPSIYLTAFGGEPLFTTTYMLADLGTGNGSNLRLSGATVPDGTVLGTATVGGASVGSVRIDTSGFAGGEHFTLSRSGQYLSLTFTPVPEPMATVAIFGAGLAAAGWWQRRRSRQHLQIAI